MQPLEIKDFFPTAADFGPDNEGISTVGSRGKKTDWSTAGSVVGSESAVCLLVWSVSIFCTVDDNDKERPRVRPVLTRISPLYLTQVTRSSSGECRPPCSFNKRLTINDFALPPALLCFPTLSLRSTLSSPSFPLPPPTAMSPESL